MVRFRLNGGWRGRVLLDESAGQPAADQWKAWLTCLISEPARLPGYEQLKYSSRNEVIKADLAPTTGTDLIHQAVICKRSTPDGRFARAAAAIGRSRAKRNFERGLRLAQLGIGTPQPLALIERRAESWLITEFLPDLIDLDHAALTVLPKRSPQESHRLKAQATSAVANLLLTLDRARLHHRDLKATNVLLQGLGTASVRAVLVDLDGLRRARVAPAGKRRQRLVRLAASLTEYPSITKTDYVRFIRTLWALQSDEAGDWKAAFRSLAAAAAKYNRRADARRAAKWRE